MATTNLDPRNKEVYALYPAIVVTRYPDHETAIELFDLSGVDVVDIDLGGSFDIGSPTERDAPAAREYARALEDKSDQFPAGHPARESIRVAVEIITMKFGQFWTVDLLRR